MDALVLDVRDIVAKMRVCLSGDTIALVMITGLVERTRHGAAAF